MWLYLIIFFIPVLAYKIGPAENRNKLFLQTYMLALMLFVGLSDMFGGYDRYIYGEVFDNLADAIERDDDENILYFLGHFEKGYSYLCYLIAHVTENRYIYIFIVTMLSYFFIYKAFERSMPNYPLAIIIFLGMSFFFTFTYLRQVLAFSVAWFSIRYLVERKWIKFILLGLIVASLHKSGIIFLVLALLPLKKWQPSTIVFILIICAAIGLTGITGRLYETFIGVSEIQSASRYSTGEEMRLAYVLEVIFFAWLILTNYNKIQPTRKNLVFLNIAWSFIAVLLLFMRSSEGGRLTWYFTIGIIYIFSLICTYNQKSLSVAIAYTLSKNKNLLNYLVISLMILLYLRVYTGWQTYHSLYPYKTFLTDGYRPEDMYRVYYEYDYTYDLDKFYRPAFKFIK